MDPFQALSSELAAGRSVFVDIDAKTVVRGSARSSSTNPATRTPASSEYAAWAGDEDPLSVRNTPVARVTRDQAHELIQLGAVWRGNDTDRP